MQMLIKFDMQEPQASLQFSSFGLRELIQFWESIRYSSSLEHDGFWLFDLKHQAPSNGRGLGHPPQLNGIQAGQDDVLHKVTVPALFIIVTAQGTQKFHRLDGTILPREIPVLEDSISSIFSIASDGKLHLPYSL